MPVLMNKTDLKTILARIATGEVLTEQEAYDAFTIIISGNASDTQIGGFLMGLRARGEAVSEITGGARALRNQMNSVPAPPEAIDTVGTGGDGASTYNISTASAFVIAGLGVPVAKHGNKAISSKSGAADVLIELGVNIEAEHALITKALEVAKVTFLMAPRHHPAMRHVALARQELGLRTIFNLLGPLANPANVKRQLTGVYSKEWVTPVAKVLRKLQSERVWVVHGSDGLDELTTTGPTYVCEIQQGNLREFTITPEDADLPRADPAELKGGDPKTNASALINLLNGQAGAYRDIVLLNSAAALIIAGIAGTLKEGALLAATSIDDGNALSALDQLVTITNQKKFE